MARPLRSLTLWVTAWLVLASPSAMAQPDLSPQEWREDLRYMAEQVEAVHLDAFHTISREDFAAAVQDVHDRIPSLDDHEVIVELARLVTLVGDGHTRLWLSPNEANGFRRYPVLFYGFDGDLRVTAVDAEHAEAAGGRLVAIDGTPTEEVYRRVSEVVHRDNEWTVLSLLPRYLGIPEVLHALGVVDNMARTSYTFETPDGDRYNATFEPVADSLLPRVWERVFDPDASESQIPLVMARPADVGPPMVFEGADHVFRHVWLEDERAMYVQINAIRNGESQTLAAFFDEGFAEVDQVRPEKLILDLRLNGGGNNQLNRPFIQHVVRRPWLDQPGQVFVLIGRHTFSAASHFVSKMEQWTNALFVGEPTGASPLHFGDAPPITLPNSSVRLSASSLWWQNTSPFDSRTTTPPDLAAPMTFADFLEGLDPALEVALAYEPGPSLWEQVATALESGTADDVLIVIEGYWADPLRAYADTRGVLNSTGYRLMGQDRLDEAITLFEANVARHPDYANGYDSLGEALVEVGRMDEAIAAYERALALDPEGRTGANARRQLDRLRSAE